MYTRAFSTLGCADFTLDEVVALGVRHNIAQLELRALGGTLELPDYFAASGAPAMLGEKMERAGIRVLALDTSFKVMGRIPDDRRKLLEFLPLAEALHVRWLRVFDGGTTLNPAALAEAADALAWWQAERRALGSEVDLMIETHDLLLTAEKINRFVAAMPPGSVHLLWDTHHTWKKGGEDPLLTWRSVGAQVVHVHVKDSVSARSAKHPFTYVLPGTGEFPMEPLQRVLATEFGGAVSLEWERLWHPYLAPLDDALRSAALRHWW
jgi:sugar phosphate isomerase/epimerase